MPAKRSAPQPSIIRCPLTGSEVLRDAANRSTAAIQGNFPRGVSQPALRALAAAKLRTLTALTNVSEAELLALHGMGPKAVGLLRDALQAEGKSFRT